MLPYQLLQGDCLELMATIPSGSVDMVMCDLPYGTTACKWDSVIPFEPLWAAYKRVCKPNAAIVLTASQPFTSALVMSNTEMFRYCWVWDKVNRNTGSLMANSRPMRRHEDIVVFYSEQPNYHKVPCGVPPIRGGHVGGHGEYVGGAIRKHAPAPSDKTPCSVLAFPGMNSDGVYHPTQKPVALMEYLIKTYTNAGETVLDNTMGSGTTGVACGNTGRRFIGIERDLGYFNIALDRIEKAFGADLL